MAALLGVVVALIGTLTASVWGGVPDRIFPAEAATATVKIHHYNLCQGNFFCGPPDGTQRGAKYREGALDQLRRLAASDRPWFISVNEICMADYYKLRRDLKTDGVFQLAAPRHPLCGPYGSAVFTPGGVVEKIKRIELPNPGLECDKDECRWALCLWAKTNAGPMTVCTGHLETDAVVAPKQASIYHQEARAFNAEGGPGRRLVLTGDFNIGPDQLPPEYGDMVDLVQTGTDANGDPIGTFPTWTGDGIRSKATKHLDYIFVERGVGTPRPSFPYCRHPDDVTASDHCYTMGGWEF
ncbi:endonuclease/exonuclease/phosphatase family protein [Actinomadura rudentiformis]|uniref:Endonuclease/exonuclease/phosphatase family protein n=1 Tax=Actinomadura rudentiformis TaxID=359158 RepID=A0A6H9ZAI4_9ACTN|nr:endonuclease/exonuclease/phosphatase family protein [Actinomadura rudentiformis]KAB2352493.1 endonuclease/exonuclease/phosphatase family protein [Actinomadura rudentiformis]